MGAHLSCASAYDKHMPQGDLERGWARARLIRELAIGEKAQVQLAAEYGVDQSAVSAFKSRHRNEITQQRDHMADEWAGLWIADKRNRVAESQDDVEAINAALAGTADKDLLRVKLAIMRQVAEELGQLRQEIEVTGTLTYVVEGVDVSRLQ